jgi:hypothetical protein
VSALPLDIEALFEVPDHRIRLRAALAQREASLLLDLGATANIAEELITFAQENDIGLTALRAYEPNQGMYPSAGDSGPNAGLYVPRKTRRVRVRRVVDRERSRRSDLHAGKERAPLSQGSRGRGVG